MIVVFPWGSRERPRGGSPRGLGRVLGLLRVLYCFFGYEHFRLPFGRGTLILGGSPRALFARGSCRLQLTFASSPFRGEERDVPLMERALSSLVSFYQVIQARTHAPFDGVGCSLEALSLKLD
jgi:hypothetical protein